MALCQANAMTNSQVAPKVRRKPAAPEALDRRRKEARKGRALPASPLEAEFTPPFF